MSKLVFVSNYLTHHQIPLSDELYSRLGDEYYFVEMEKMSDERLNMGWALDYKKYPYRIYYYDNIEHAQRLIDEAECIIVGPVDMKVYRNRLRTNKLIVKYEERPFKKNDYQWLNPRTFRMMIKAHTSQRNKNVYMLCANAYNYYDMKRFGAYPGKMYSWGYFTKFYDYGETGPNKLQRDELKLLWVARYIDWKHPEIPIEIAKYLKNKGIRFSLTMIGDGELRDFYENRIIEDGLDSDIIRIRTVPYDEMSKYMLDADVYLMTSDRNEGWGAVVGEAMNQGCIVLGNVEAGSVPWLIEASHTGFIYQEIDELMKAIDRVVVMTSNQRSTMQKNAYLKIKNQWNASVAAERLLEFISNPEEYDSPETGVCVRLNDRTIRSL